MTDERRPIVVDLLAEDFHERAHSLYDRLRALSPVTLVELPQQPGRTFWLVTGYTAADTALRDSRLVNSSRAVHAKAPASNRRARARLMGSPANMLLSDPPDHTRLRRIARQAFTPALVAGLRSAITQRAERLLDASERAARNGDGTIDLLDAYAYPLALAVMGEILGFPKEWYPELQALAVQAAAGSTPLLAPEDSLQTRLEGYARELVALKRNNPADDMASRLVHPKSGESHLSNDELVAMIGLLTAAGYETSASVIGSATLALASHPEQWKAVCENPKLAGAAVEEAMRFWGPVESATMRYATAPFTLAGQPIGFGERVLICLSAANRDPAHVADPHRFDIHRKASGHLGFSGGIHTCLGAAIARIEVKVALNTLVRRWPNLRLATDPQTPNWRRGTGLRGLQRLLLRPSPAARAAVTQPKRALPHTLSTGDGDWGSSLNQLRQLVGELTGVSVEALADDANLFDVGLDSVNIMRISGLMRRAGNKVEYRDLMRRPTLDAWAQLLGGSPSNTAPAPVATVDESKPFPLAVMQHAFWIGQAASQPLGGVSAHLYSEFDRAGGLDLDRLERAVQALLKRHGMLRMVVDATGMQRVSERSHWPGLLIDDLRSLSEAECERRLAETSKMFSHRAMNVEAGEVFDLQVSLLPKGRSRLHLNLEMIAGDALSLRTLLVDLTRFYQYGPDALPTLRYSYARYLVDRARARATAREHAREWWQTQLPTLPGAPDFPLLSPENVTDDPRVDRRHFWLSPERAALLNERARSAGLTTAGLLATVFAETIGAWSGTDRFLLNVPVFAREPLHEDVDKVVGDFSSSVLLDIDLSTPKSIAQRGQAIQDRLQTVLGYSAYTGVEVLRDASRANGGERVLAPVVYTSALSLGELYAPEVRQCLGEPCWTVSQGPQVWLDAQVTEFDGGVLLNWDARVSLFPSGMFDAMFDAYVRFVELLLTDEKAWHGEAPWPSGSPLADTTPEAEPEPLTPLHLRFFARAAADPQRTALLADGEVITYGELAVAARRMARLLQTKGVGRGDSVGITLPKGVDQIVATLGVLAVGATYVPSGLDVPPARRARVLDTAGARWVIVDAATAGTWPDAVEQISTTTSSREEPIDEIVAVDPEDVMYVIFTSGSTGTPKGVEVPHRAVAHTIEAVNRHFDIGPDDRTISLSALDFDLSAYDLFAFLGYGGSVVVVEEPQRRDAAAWAELIRRWDVTVISAVPALLDMLLIAAAESGLGSALRVVMLGGDRVTVDLPDRLCSLVPGCRFAGLGGMTEAAIHATICEVDTVDPDWSCVPYGVPLSHAQCRVVDGRGRDRPSWVPGELWVAGLGLAHGYRGDPEQTAEKFVEREGVRWYRTGDLVRYRSDETMEFLGRIDHQVKIRGHRIELGEIEAVLADHPQIAAAAAVVVEHATRQLAAVIVCHDDVEDDVIRAFLGERLPSYMIPRRFVRRAELPITRNGKIDRAAVQVAVAANDRNQEDHSEAPKGRTEQIVARIWAELLGVDEVGRDDDFFALGGDSLLATKLIRRLAADGLTGAGLVQLFTKPMLADFVATLKRGDVEQVPTIEADPDHRLDPFALTDIQRAFWIGRSATMELGGIGSYFYLEFDGEGVDVDRLDAAWQRVIARHEMLRAVVSPQGEQQILSEIPPYQIDRVQPGRSAEHTLHRLRERLSHKVFDVTQWPLFTICAASYTRDGAQRTRLYVGIDSIIADGRSIMVLFSDWDRLYRNPKTVLPPVEVSFRDYVRQIEPDSARVEQARNYWRQRVRELPPAPDLPLARSPGEIERPRFHRLHHTIEPAAWRRITEKARAHRITPNVVLLTCYVQLLGGWSTQNAITVNVTMFDRRETSPAVHDVVGDFASLLLLGHTWASDEAFVDVARRLQHQQSQDLSEREASGIWALRELARHRGTPTVAMPVVFTSVLGVGDDGASLELSSAFPDQIYGLTQTPQVWLDNKIADSRGGISIDWDVVTDLFPEELAEAMFDGYLRLVEALAEADWSRPLEALTAKDRRLLEESMPKEPPAVSDERTEATAASPVVSGDASPLEATVARLWQELLGVDRVERTDDFFDLGGDSIIATRLMSALRAEGLANAQLARLFTHPVLHEFAGTITAQSQAAAPAAPRLEAEPSQRHEPFPLTDIQAAYWLGRSEHFDLGGIGAQLYVEYDWPSLDLGRLEAAWNRLIGRHGMLRAVFAGDGTQRVLDKAPAYRIRVIEAQGDFDGAVADVRDSMSGTSLDPDTWPLFDIRIVRDDGRARVCATIDNLIADGLSTLVLISEWTRLYADPNTELAPLAIEFRDYATKCVPTSEEMQAGLSYWRARLAELPPGPQLPLRLAPSAVERPRFHRRELRLDLDTWQRIVARGRSHSLTPSIVLLACYTSVLGAWSAQRDLTVTLTRFDRRDVHPDIMRVVGDFTSLLLVADRPSGKESWLSRARRLQEQLWRDLDHQQVSAVRVLRELAREKAALAEPVPVVFTSMLGVDDELARSVRWPEHTRSQTPQVWLDHQVIELPDGLLLSWDSVDELFPDGMVDDMLAAYHDQLRQLADADWTQSPPDLLPSHQKAIRDKVNDTEGPRPEQLSSRGLLHAGMFDIADAEPNRVAIIAGDRTRFGALAERSRRIAALLIEHGVRPGDAAAVTAARGAEQVAALYGILAAGAAYVPVAKDQPPQRRAAILERAAVSLWLVDDPDAYAPASVPSVAISDADRYAPAPVYRGSADDIAYVIFTSGSTGVPKGVEMTHASAVNTLDDLNRRYEIGANDRMLCVATIDFDLSVFDLFGVLGAGGSVVLTMDEERRDPDRWLTLMREHEVTLWNSVPAMLDMLLTTAEAGSKLPSTLRLAFASGDWVGLDLPGRLAALSKNCRLVALGGATEAAIWSNFFEVDAVDPEWTSIPYGRPLRNQRFRVVDEIGRDQPDWVPGELLIGGAGVGRGYRGEPELTAAAFFELEGTRWYRTGDLGRYHPDGTLEFLGRADRQVKVRGHRVELGEIEQAITAHPEVRRAVALAVGPKKSPRLVAFVEPEIPDDLHELLSDRVPSAWLPELISLSDPPLTGNGKIDHAALARRAASMTAATQSEPGEPLQPGPETQIGRLWAEELGKAPAHRHLSFFGAGGDSLSATRLMTRLQRELGVAISLREFFTNPTVAALAHTLPVCDIPTEEGIL